MDKITIVGAGRVGESTAQILAQRDMCHDLVLIDVREGAAAGAALDIRQSAAAHRFDCRLSGGSDPTLMADSDLVIITAGSPRKPGMSRSDVLHVNSEVINNIVDDVLEHTPDCLLLMVTNPVDVLTWQAWKRTGWDRRRVFGQAGVLDAARMASFMAEQTGISVRDIHTMVIGGHGDSMVPLTRFSTINGLPVEHFVDGETIEYINEKTRHGGAEVLEMRQHSSAYNAPAAAVATMVDAIKSNRDRLLSCVCVLQGEYGHQDIPAGVPAILGRDGIMKIVELPLNETEQSGFQASIDSIVEDIKAL